MSEKYPIPGSLTLVTGPGSISSGRKANSARAHAVHNCSSESLSLATIGLAKILVESCKVEVVKKLRHVPAFYQGRALVEQGRGSSRHVSDKLSTHRWKTSGAVVWWLFARVEVVVGKT